MYQELISKTSFIKATGLDKFKLEPVAGPMMKMIRLDEINRIYRSLEQYEGRAFLDEFVKLLGIKLEIAGKGLEKIPAHGPFIVVSNHPFGILEEILLLQIITDYRPDFKVMTPSLLQQIERMQEYFVSGINHVSEYLDEGHPVGIFPAGEVSSFRFDERRIADREWQKSAVKLIQKANVPVVPVYFQGTNSPLFHLMGLVHPTLRTATIPSELIRKKHTEIRVNVGKPILPKEVSQIEDTERFGRYLRARTYSLKSGMDVKPFFENNDLPANFRPVAEPTDPTLILAEINQLRETHILFTQNDMEVFCCQAENIPHILRELGRLREFTFRLVGEGTGKPLDIDEYDLYYRQLFIWDRKNEKIVGAYRLGMGPEIMTRYGKKGFYLHSLFKINNNFRPYMAKSIELGRSFVLPEYQKHRLPLFLLWKGISQVIAENKTIQYLIGPVSISNRYSLLSRSFIVAFIRKYHFDEGLAAWIIPRKKFRPKKEKSDIQHLMNGSTDDLKLADKVIEDMEPHHLKLPILLKKYIKQNARIISFNVDPHFNQCLDGFIFLDLKELPDTTLENYF
ncbi:MAG: GNAT family N-acyltransferase [Bacteroidia bacterium]|nr:GNAT family N-acyltransferase [Bacteroidia bacterium]